MSEKFGIVWNPSKIGERELREAIENALDSSADPRLEVLWFATSEDDPGRAAAQQALDAGCTVVVAAGGDGTVRAVAERLGESGSPAAELGILPLGTGNLLARNLGVPLGDPERAFARVLNGDAAPLDLGEAEVELASGETQRHGFVVMVGFGIDAQMIAETDDDLKAKAGWLAYVESLGRAVAGTEVAEMSLALDGGEASSVSAHTMLIGNCGTVQGGLALLPDAAPDDGELDLLVLGADDVGSWLGTVRNMVWNNGLKRLVTRSEKAESSESTQHLRAREARVELPRPLALEVDGDEIGEVVSFSVRLLPSALLVR